MKIDPQGMKLVRRHSRSGSFARENGRLQKPEARLEEREGFGRSVLDSLAANVAVIDERGDITTTNGAWIAFARANGDPPFEKIGTGANYFEVCRQAKGPDAWIARSALEGINGVLKGERGFFELEYPCHSPEVKRWFIVRATPLEGYKGKMAVITHFDVTDRVLAREAMESTRTELEEGIRQRTAELEEARSRAEFYVDIMAHDIGNMDQIAMGYLEMANSILLSGPGKKGEVQSMLSQSIETLDEIARLIGNIRKVQMGKTGAYSARAINIGDLLERVQAQYQNIPGREIDISFDQKNNCDVMANDLLYEAFSNLAGNSIKHSRGPVKICIRTECYADRGKILCRISIEDNGPGIPDQVKGELIQCKAPGHASGKARGMGICLTKMLIAEFGGQFSLEDRVRGDHSKGLRAVVILPAI